MGILITIGIVLVTIVAIVGAFSARYMVAKSDEAIIVTGSFLGSKNIAGSGSRKFKIISGGGTFVIPVFQTANRVSLQSVMLDVRTSEVYTGEGVPITVDGTAIIKVGNSIESISTAAEQFLGREKEIQTQSKEVAEGHLRSILSSMSVEEIYKDREKFNQKVQEEASTDLNKMGLQIVSFTIKDITDRNGYLDSLGKPRIAAVQRDAAIAEADAKMQARQRKAKAEREAKQAEILSETEIAEAEKEQALKVSAYKTEQDRAKAVADQAYHLQTARSNQEVKEEEMRVQIIERQKQIELEEKEILRREKQYDAEVKKKADADRYAVEQAAEAAKRRRVLEAEADAEQKRLDGIAVAEADKARGNAEAEVARNRGNAEADVIREKGLAEAEAKEKLAEAYEKFGQAAVLDIVVKMLPELAKEIAKPLGNIDKITVVDSGGNGQGGGASKVSKYVTDLMATMPEMVKDVSDVDIKKIIHTLTEKDKAGETIVEEEEISA